MKSTIVLLCIMLCITQYLCSSALGENKSGLKPQVISLPTGAGSVEGLGESFEPQLNSGTGTYSVKISVPPGVNGYQPNISLGYNSGQGKGPFGIGWALNVPYIQRQTDKGLPRYDEGDTFIYSDGEELIPIGNNVYRSENEETFIRFERIGDYWEARDRSGILHRFGRSASCRVQSNGKVFKWCLEEKTDTNGNIITYQYFRDSLQIYLSQIQYSKVDEENFNLLEFQYEERTDCFSDYRSTFEIKTAKRCSAIKVCSQGSLVRKYVLSYKAGSSFSLLAKITQVGDDNSGTLPELTFGYSELQTNIASVISMDSPPSYSLLRDDTEIIDLNGDSLPDIIHTESGNHQYYLNEGNNKWSSKQYVTESPLANLSKDGTQLADIDGDGLADLLDWRGSSPTTYRYYPNHGENWWGDSVFFANNPSFDFEDVNIELVDINNDKIIDVMHTGSSSYHYYINNGDGSWNEESYWSPALEAHRFADPNFRLADMNGDRMLDLVYIHRTSTIATINYWPNMGYGHWDSKATITGPLLVGSTQGALLLTDVNSDGLSDLVAVKSRKVNYWINLGNDTWGDTYEILDTPLYDHSKTTIRIADMNGNGSKDILWDTYPAYSYQRLRYLDFVGETRPNLLTTIDNGLGKKTEIEYQLSTYYFLTARENGEQWQTKPPFPVHVVSKVTVTDGLGGIYITDYVYRDGFYDGKEKEFRGFAYVEKIEQGDSSAPTTVTKLWFNTGREIECLKGKELKREITSDTGILYTSEENRWDSRVLYTETNGRAVTFSFIDRKDAFLFEGTSSPVQIQQEFDYDAFGNLIKDLNYGQVVDGDRSVGNDELLTCKEYAVNETIWIVDRKSREVKTALAGNFVSESRYYYDGDPFTGLPLGMVEKGNLTRQEDSLGPLGENRFISTLRKQYDSYGNVTGIKDANDNLRTIIYDLIFHTFPVEETIHLGGDKSLSITANYHLGFGKVINSTDFNRNLTQYTYDTFGRLKKIIKPGDTLSLPTLEYSYNLGGPISSILTKTRERSGEENTHESITYFDGLGKKRQTVDEAEYGQYVVKEAKEFNLKGTAKAVYLPYFALSFAYETPGSDKPKISTFYDAAGRVIKTVNPGGTFSSAVYLPLQQVLYDEEDNRLDSSHANTPFTNSYDGHNRLIQVEENNQNVRYITSYQYDPLDNLTQINDAQGNIKTMVYDALGRKLEMNDPDCGKKVYEYDDAG
ncbi:MAG: VCBS repeat-containing protein, partial [Desulfobacteraceae bacterium]|nr:VCBS repeat-containing protein [Desulfobacteraceae bacterium]